MQASQYGRQSAAESLLRHRGLVNVTKDASGLILLYSSSNKQKLCMTATDTLTACSSCPR